MWELDHKEGWAAKNWCFRIVVLETSESSVDCKEIKPVHPKGNQHCIFIGRTNAEAPILWPPDAKSWLTGKDPDAGKDWGQGKGATEDEIVRWHHQLNGHELVQTPGDSKEQGSLECCSSRGHRESGHHWTNNMVTLKGEKGKPNKNPTGKVFIYSILAHMSQERREDRPSNFICMLLSDT